MVNGMRGAFGAMDYIIVVWCVCDSMLLANNNG